MNSQDKISDFVVIMQLYIFPNISHMNLVHASDTTVFYDVVNFIKRGWINRNQIILNRLIYKFTVSLKKASQKIPINVNRVEIIEASKLDHCIKNKYL